MSKTMTKRKIANAVAERIGITQSEAFKSVKAVLETISDILGNDGHIELRGFGVFEIVTQRPRVQGRQVPRRHRTGRKGPQAEGRLGRRDSDGAPSSE